MVLATDTISQALSGLAGGVGVPVPVMGPGVLALLALELGRLTIGGGRRIRPRTPKLEEVASRALADSEAATEIARRSPGPLAERTVVDLAQARDSGRD